MRSYIATFDSQTQWLLPYVTMATTRHATVSCVKGEPISGLRNEGGVVSVLHIRNN